MPHWQSEGRERRGKEGQTIKCHVPLTVIHFLQQGSTSKGSNKHLSVFTWAPNGLHMSLWVVFPIQTTVILFITTFSDLVSILPKIE